MWEHTHTHSHQESSRELAVTGVKADTLLCAAGCVCARECLIKFSSLTGRIWLVSKLHRKNKQTESDGVGLVV